MVPSPDYNPNYEERRGRYAPCKAQDNVHMGNDRQNAAMPNDEMREAQHQDKKAEEEHRDKE
jgi:hypothetical protein